jgi:molybdate transport repressor ModE-like protein
MSYRRAWSLVQETNESAGEPLVEAAVGGIKGGGAILTERGKFALEVYEQVHKSLLESAAIVLQRIVQPSAQECIHLATAISLQEVVGQLLAEYTLRKPAIRIRAVFGASNELAAHVLAGAPCDIFVSAERDEIDRLEQAQLLVANSRRIVAINGLAAIGVPGIKSIRKIGDLLSSWPRRIASASPSARTGSVKYNLNGEPMSSRRV